MPQTLTSKEFADFVHLYTTHHAEIVTTLAAHTARLDKIDATLADHTKRLERIENILWDGQRVAEIERRLIKIAETVGLPELATPITRPIGT